MWDSTHSVEKRGCEAAIIRVHFYSFLRDRSKCQLEVWVLCYCFCNVFFLTKSEFSFVSGIKMSVKIPKSLKRNLAISWGVTHRDEPSVPGTLFVGAVSAWGF